MAKQIVANNGELPPSVALSVPVKPVENVGAQNIKSLPRSGRACSGRVILIIAYHKYKTLFSSVDVLPVSDIFVQVTSIQPSATQQLQRDRKDLDWSTMG